MKCGRLSGWALAHLDDLEGALELIAPWESGLQEPFEEAHGGR